MFLLLYADKYGIYLQSSSIEKTLLYVKIASNLELMFYAFILLSYISLAFTPVFHQLVTCGTCMWTWKPECWTCGRILYQYLLIFLAHHSLRWQSLPEKLLELVSSWRGYLPLNIQYFSLDWQVKRHLLPYLLNNAVSLFLWKQKSCTFDNI